MRLFLLTVLGSTVAKRPSRHGTTGQTITASRNLIPEQTGSALLEVSVDLAVSAWRAGLHAGWQVVAGCEALHWTGNPSKKQTVWELHGMSKISRHCPKRGNLQGVDFTGYEAKKPDELAQCGERVAPCATIESSFRRVMPLAFSAIRQLAENQAYKLPSKTEKRLEWAMMVAGYIRDVGFLYARGKECLKTVNILQMLVENEPASATRAYEELTEKIRRVFGDRRQDMTGVEALLSSSDNRSPAEVHQQVTATAIALQNCLDAVLEESSKAAAAEAASQVPQEAPAHEDTVPEEPRTPPKKPPRRSLERLEESAQPSGAEAVLPPPPSGSTHQPAASPARPLPPPYMGRHSQRRAAYESEEVSADDPDSGEMEQSVDEPLQAAYESEEVSVDDPDSGEMEQSVDESLQQPQSAAASGLDVPSDGSEEARRSDGGPLRSTRSGKRTRGGLRPGAGRLPREERRSTSPRRSKRRRGADDDEEEAVV